jgi:hypothetical protein
VQATLCSFDPEKLMRRSRQAQSVLGCLLQIEVRLGFPDGTGWRQKLKSPLIRVLGVVPEEGFEPPTKGL